MPATAALRRPLLGPLACLVAFALGALGGCGDDDPEPVPSASSDPPTTTAPTTTLSQHDRDEAALRQLTEDWYEAIDAIVIDGADPNRAEEFATDGYLDAFLSDIDRRRASGTTSERSDASRVTIDSISVEADTATVTTCVVDGNLLFAADGTLLNDDVATFRFVTSALVTPDGWRFSRQHQQGQEIGGDQCPD